MSKAVLDGFSVCRLIVNFITYRDVHADDVSLKIVIADVCVSAFKFHVCPDVRNDLV